jgi:nickel-type superoxide dismutase maturation protease
MRKRWIVGVLAGVAVARASGRWFPVRVEGESMTPTLQPGDFVAVRALRASEPAPGQIVVARFDDREVVKRVVRVADGAYWLEGDNSAASTDSRTHGPVKREQIAGLVRARYKPFTSARWLG